MIGVTCGRRRKADTEEAGHRAASLTWTRYRPGNGTGQGSEVLQGNSDFQHSLRALPSFYLRVTNSSGRGAWRESWC